MKAPALFASILKIFGAVGYTNLPKRCTFDRLLQLLLNWRIKVATIVNCTQMSLECTWTINNYVCGSLICLCWLNRTHFWNLLSKLFSTLRPSEMLLLFINFLISIFASTFYRQVILRTINAQISNIGEKSRKLDTLAKLFHCTLTQLSDNLRTYWN